MWANFNTMPKLLKFLTVHAAFCFVFFVGSVVPSNSFSMNGQHVTYAEWWSSGAGPFASLIGLVGPLVAWSLLSKWQHARLAYVVFLALGFIAPYPFLGMLPYVLPGMLVVGIGAFYMYRWQSVQVYFAP
jgi:hypothetical protein